MHHDFAVSKDNGLRSTKARWLTPLNTREQARECRGMTSNVETPPPACRACLIECSRRQRPPCKPRYTMCPMRQFRDFALEIAGDERLLPRLPLAAQHTKGQEREARKEFLNFGFPRHSLDRYGICSARADAREL